MENALDKSVYGSNKLAQWGVSDGHLSMGRRWLAFWCLFAFGAGCMYQNMGLAPMLAQLAENFGMGMDTAGWLMSVYNIVGLLVAYPCTWIMQKFGIKFSLVSTGILSLLGCIICLFSVSGGMFMVGRVIQGCAFGLTAVLAPNIMPRMFPMEKQGLVMGIWSQWVTPGIAAGSLTTPILFNAFGWQSVIVCMLCVQVITTILVFATFKLPTVPENMMIGGQARSEEHYGKTFVKSAVVLGFSFLAWCTMYGTFNTYYPTFAQQVVGLDMGTASLTTLVTALVTIPTGILFGVVADKIRRRRVMLIIGYICMLVVYSFLLWGGQNATMMWIGCVLLGLICAALIPTMTRATIPVLAQKPKQTDWALTGMAFVTCLGSLLAAFFSAQAMSSSWGQTGLIWGLVICIVVVIVIFFVKDDHDIDLTDTGEGKSDE